MLCLLRDYYEVTAFTSQPQFRPSRQDVSFRKRTIWFDLKSSTERVRETNCVRSHCAI